MAKSPPHVLLAEALERRRKRFPGQSVFRTEDFTPADLKRLKENGYLQPIMNGWLMSTRPTDKSGDTTSWYMCFWEFCSRYLTDRFGADWVLSPEASLSIHAENRSVPKQLVIQSGAAANAVVKLPRGSIFTYRKRLPAEGIEQREGLRVYSAAAALVGSQKHFWNSNKSDVIAVLASLRSVSAVLEPLLATGEVVAAERIAGAYKLLGRDLWAETILSAMDLAGYSLRIEADPFADNGISAVAFSRSVPPLIARTQSLWRSMRPIVQESFDAEPTNVTDIDAWVHAIDDKFVSDAYHSLSIEGYHVSAELIEKIRAGSWRPEEDEDDKNHRNAMAAKGYFNAFKEVTAGIRRVLEGRLSPAELIEREHLKWYQFMFGPSVEAGLIKPQSLSGYRNHPVYLRGSAHAPTRWEVIPDAMEGYFDSIKSEEDARVRSVLGHFVFTYIHPFPDGNGRSGRFILNAMLATAGFPWTIIPVDRRDEYMDVLNIASVENDIGPFTRFIVDCMKYAPEPKKGTASRLREPNVDHPSAFQP